MSQNVNVNLVPGNYPKEFHVSQYDVGRQLVANIVDSTGAYSIPSGATVTLVGTKPSGFGFTLSGSVGSGGVVTFSTTATVTAEYGRIPCEIRITSGSTILGTANCMLIVEESPHPEGTTDGDGEQIISEITLLLQRITEQADRADQAVTDATAQANRATAQATAAAGSASAAASSESNAAASATTAVGAKNDAVAAKTAAEASEASAAESAAEARETLETYAKVDGEYDGMTVGTAKQLLSDSTTTDTEPYIYRQTAGDGDREEIEVVGGTVAWNQLCNSASVTVPNGHKYYMIKGGTASIGASTGTAITGLTSGTDIVTDLTAMFGTAIADAIYAMEQASAGAGAAWFKALFSKAYYPYNAGELMSVKTSAHVTTGFNQWDEEWELGTINTNTGAKGATSDSIRCKNDIRVFPDTTYYLRISATSNTIVYYYREDMSFISASGGKQNATFKTPSDCAWLRFVSNELTDHDICINLSDPSRNGEYEPYVKHTYPLDSSLTLRGVPKLVDGKLAYDGDVYLPSGEVQRRYGLRAYQSGDESLADAITDGANTVYKLATPTTETADPYTAIQVCDPNGTEEWTDERTVQIPVGNVTKYHANLKEKLEDLPAIPSAPSANGTYTLKATVSGGAVTYQWVNG